MTQTSPVTTSHGRASFSMGGPGRYGVAVAVTVAGVLSQYVVPAGWFPAGWAGFALSLFQVYGFGLLAFYWAFRAAPLRNFGRHMGVGVREGLRWYGVFGVLGLVLAVVLTNIYLKLDPRTGELLSRITPVIQEGSQNTVFFILFSIFFVGFVEETLFRGYVFGGALRALGTRNWGWTALWTSLLFAGVHLYYAQTYLEVSPIYYVRIVTLGLAFSFAYYHSRGNLLVVALLHGGFDAMSFGSLFPGALGTAFLALSLLFLLACGLYALVLHLRRVESTPPPLAPAPYHPMPWVSPSGMPAPPPPPPPMGIWTHCILCGMPFQVPASAAAAPCPRCGSWNPLGSRMPFPGVVPPARDPIANMPPGAWPPA